MVYFWLICMVDVGKYTIHGCYGLDKHCCQMIPNKKMKDIFFSRLWQRLWQPHYISVSWFAIYVGWNWGLQCSRRFFRRRPPKTDRSHVFLPVCSKRNLIHNSFIPDGKSISTFHWLLRRQGSKSRLEDLKQLANQRKSWREGMKHFFAIFISQYFKHVT